MADAIYPKWKEARLEDDATAALDGSGSTGVFAALIDTSVYTYNVADEFWDEGGAADPVDGLIGSLVELGTKTFANGLFDAADAVLTSVTGNPVDAIIIVIKNAGAETTWRIAAYIDSAAQITPDGNNINIAWNASGIFQL